MNVLSRFSMSFLCIVYYTMLAIVPYISRYNTSNKPEFSVCLTFSILLIENLSLRFYTVEILFEHFLF